jgi:lysophospholipase L1-like esterase
LNRLTLPLVVLAIVSTACDRSPVGPTPQSLAISCPASAAASSADGNPVAVTFSRPTVSGGALPVTTTCDRQSGSLFGVGTTTVTCTARDAQRQSATCSYSITVTRVPQIRATRFVAFGDSITEGATASCERVTPFMSFAETMLVLQTSANDVWTYPNVLQNLLRSRYPAQLPTVSNRGRGGESVFDGNARLPGVLAQDMPEVLLIQEGANDVNASRDAADIAASLRSMVRVGRDRGALVLLGTLLPQRPIQLGSCRGYGASRIAAVNDQIRAVAAGEQVVLVDLFQAFGGVPGDLIGADGLHPSEAGYRQIAESFFVAIVARLEIAASASTAIGNW